MTYLEVHTDEKVHRWEIKWMPKGPGEKGYLDRVKFINMYLTTYSEVMAYAMEGAKIYIVHQSKMKHATINRRKSDR